MGSKYEEISFVESLSLDGLTYCRAAHVLLYAKWQGLQFGRYPFKYAVMMQVRFDGTLGFPGGIVDEGETPEGAVTRELLEEMGGGVSIEHSDHVMTTYSTHTKFILHFYAKKVSMETFRKIEEGVTKSKEWGSEVMGVTRCPLYTLPNGLGFPGFLACNFIGSSREQLLETLKRLDLLSEEEITRAIELSKQKVLVTKETIGY